MNSAMNMPPNSTSGENLAFELRPPTLLEFQGSYPKEGRFDFKVRLHFHALAHLAADARKSIRLYELFRIIRPGDIWKYLWVEVVDVPDAVRDQVSRSREKSGIKYMRPPWPANFIPFVDFDRLFYWCWDDTEPEHACWLGEREKPIFRDIADEEMAKIRQVQDELRKSQDVLIVHELSQISVARHDLDYVAAPAIFPTLPDYQSITAGSKRTPEYYVKLGALLSSPEVKSVSAVGDRDFEINRLIFSEQRRRANEQSCKARKALLVCILSDGLDYVDEWGGFALYYQEGIGDAELFIEFDGRYTLPQKLQSRPDRRYPLLFSPRDDGEIEGYSKEIGPGWVLYRRTTNTSGKCSRRVD